VLSSAQAAAPVLRTGPPVRGRARLPRKPPHHAPQPGERTERHPMPASPIVVMNGISISFPGVQALGRVNFRLFPGDVTGPSGENGAGKSTLIKALTGVYTIDEGEVVIAGQPRRLAGTADAQTAGVSTVYQEVNLCTNISIGENVMLGHETRGPLGINWRDT